MKRAPSILPVSLPPLGINREQAAELINISPTLFDRLVADGRMPEPRVIHGRHVWDVEELSRAFRALPHRAERIDAGGGQSNPWNDA